MRYFLENDILKVEIESFGAEIKSVIRKDCNREYMWWGNSKFWGRTSPVLFPIVGSVKDKKFRVDETEYTMGQHGFARDTEFELAEKNETEIWFAINSNAETMKKYPYEFKLCVGYRLLGDTVKVLWKVQNIDNKDIYFSIGAHPAFLCPVHGENNKSDYKIEFSGLKSNDEISFHGIDVASGLSINNHQKLLLKAGQVQLTDTFFDNGALIFEGKQATGVSIVDSNNSKIVSVKFDTELFALWSPEGKNAPFICIEPWYGRCDAVDFSGEFKDREYTNRLEAGQEFNSEYSVCFHKI